MIRRTVVGELDIEDPTDYMHKRGRLVVFVVGPLAVWWNGADGPTLGFTWTFARWQWGHTFGAQEVPGGAFGTFVDPNRERVHVTNLDTTTHRVTITSAPTPETFYGAMRAAQERADRPPGV